VINVETLTVHFYKTQCGHQWKLLYGLYCRQCWFIHSPY